MTELRRQLESARQRHQMIRYPGDLAIDAMPIAHNMRRWIIGSAGIAAAAIAAMVALVVMIRTDTDIPGVDPDAPYEISLSDIPAMPAMPDDIEVVPQYVELAIPSMPSIPSISELQAEQQEWDSAANNNQLPT